ncbi:protease inhibitor I42 family protein [Streptomyces sp. LX-29]|uniref:protease inhibitor I42 family protein n=1 Tax=Streptomyces sp. LX-29 TaxID=2900152 RepID=UPI00240D830A|nr:protease inhibitor I42 family protein [Streptomyces sp. LX-29]WFB09123.1 protease inhibitor I42 family protein [Streptomyces sp. LX-29]
MNLRPARAAGLVLLAVAVAVAGYFGARTLWGTDAERAERVYGARDTAVEVSPGETFTIKVDANPTTGFKWIIDQPAPARGVVKALGEDYEGDASDRVGAGGTLRLRFQARDAGSTEIKLLHCMRCGTPSAEPEGDGAENLTFHVTVR